MEKKVKENIKHIVFICIWSVILVLSVLFSLKRKEYNSAVKVLKNDFTVQLESEKKLKENKDLFEGMLLVSPNLNMYQTEISQFVKNSGIFDFGTLLQITKNFKPEWYKYLMDMKLETFSSGKNLIFQALLENYIKKNKGECEK